MKITRGIALGIALLVLLPLTAGVAAASAIQFASAFFSSGAESERPIPGATP